MKEIVVIDTESNFAHIINEKELEKWARDGGIKANTRIFRVSEELKVSVTKTLTIGDKDKVLISCEYPY